MIRLGVFALLMVATALAQQRFDAVSTPQEKPHVAILKQINQINNDGSYTYGFEAADGSFRVETRDIHGNVKGKYGYVDEFGQTKTVEYEAGKPQGFMPHGQHLPVIPRPSTTGNVDDEFGTDEDWQSVDADQDGHPDPPRPKDQRNNPIIQSVRRPAAPTFVPAATQSAQHSDRPQQIFIPASSLTHSEQQQRQQQQHHRQSTPTFIPAGTQSFRPVQPTFIPVQQLRQPQPQRDNQEFDEPLFPFQLASIAPRAPQPLPQPVFGGFVPVPFSFQQRQQRHQQH